MLPTMVGISIIVFLTLNVFLLYLFRFKLFERGHLFVGVEFRKQRPVRNDCSVVESLER